MTESIGNIYNTGIPELSDPADIQEALRIYHYGAPSGSGAGKYSTSNTSTANLVNPSMAYHLHNLQNQITNLPVGIPATFFSTKGSLIAGTGLVPPAGLQVVRLDAGQSGQVLFANPLTSSGLEWRFPTVTESNTATLLNKTLTSPVITGSGVRFAGPDGNSFVTTLTIPTPSANKTILLPPTSSIPDPQTTLVGTDTIQELTNKTIGVGQLSGQVPIASGGTGANDAPTARSNLQIFNAQTANTAGVDRQPYSGKIYVVDPAIAGPTGANLENVQQGDLWFW
jgi:hypothetical protein